VSSGNLVVNRLLCSLKFCVLLKLPIWRTEKKMLEDIAILTGGSVISERKV